MSQLKPELVRNNTFDSFTGDLPDNWTSIALTNATRVQLLRTDPREHPRRTVFTPRMKSSDYIFDGSGALRVTMASGASADEFRLRTSAAAAAGVLVNPLQRYAVTIAARCSVAGNLGRTRIIGILGTTDTYYLRPINGAAYHHQHGKGFEFVTTNTPIDFALSDYWQEFGFEVDIPVGVTSISIEIANGSAGTAVYDFGRVSLTEQTRELVGA